MWDNRSSPFLAGVDIHHFPSDLGIGPITPTNHKSHEPNTKYELIIYFINFIINNSFI